MIYGVLKIGAGVQHTTFFVCVRFFTNPFLVVPNKHIHVAATL